MHFGARWNAAGSIRVTYLNADLGTALANARYLFAEKLAGQPFSAEDLEPSELPVLISLEVPGRRFLDVVTRDAIVANGLPATYPADAMGNVVSGDALASASGREPGTTGYLALHACRPQRTVWRRGVGLVR